MENILGDRFHEVIEIMYREDNKIIFICKSNLWRGKSKIIIDSIITKEGLIKLRVTTEDIE